MKLSELFTEAATRLSATAAPNHDDGGAVSATPYMATALFLASGSDRLTHANAVGFAAKHGIPAIDAYAYADTDSGIERQSCIFDALTLLSLLAEEEGQ